MESYFSKSPDYDCKVVTEKLFYILQSSILFHRFTTRFKSIIFQCSHLCDVLLKILIKSILCSLLIPIIDYYLMYFLTPGIFIVLQSIFFWNIIKSKFLFLFLSLVSFKSCWFLFIFGRTPRLHIWPTPTILKASRKHHSVGLPQPLLF